MVAVDPRIDLLSGLGGLTRWGTTAYGEFRHSVKAAGGAALRGCAATAPAVALLEGAARFRFDAPYRWALHHGPVPDLVPPGPPPASRLRAWDHRHGPSPHWRRPSARSRAPGRSAPSAMQAGTALRVAGWIRAADPTGWLDRALGPSTARPAVLLAGIIDWHGHGATVRRADGAIAHAILGGKGVDGTDLPVYGSPSDVPAVVLHDLAHDRLNPAAEAAWTTLPERARAAWGSPGDFAESAVQGLTFVYGRELWGRAGEERSKRPPHVEALGARRTDLRRQRPRPVPEAAMAALADAVPE